MIELSVSIVAMLASFGLYARTAAVGRQIETSLGKVKDAVVQEINYSLLTPAERESLNIPAPKVKVERSEAPDGKQPWEIEACRVHTWSSLWLDTPRRKFNQKFTGFGSEDQVYVRRCLECGERNVKGALKSGGKDYDWYLD